MSLIKEGYSRPDFRIKTELKDKLRDYLWDHGRQSMAKYIENAVINQMVRDGIIVQNDKSD